MFLRITQSLKFLVDAMRAEATAKQIALGCSLGVVIGILPKSNLTAVFFLVLLFGLRVNLAAGLITAAVCSFFAAAADPFFHHIGDSLLTITPLQGLYQRLFGLPVVAWAHLNNTVVAGATLIGLVQLYPTYRLLTLVFQRRLNDHSVATTSSPLKAATS